MRYVSSEIMMEFSRVMGMSGLREQPQYPESACRANFADSGGSQASKNIFKLTFPGQELYVMTSPRDIAQVYKNTAELTFDTFIRQTLKSLGASSSAIEKWIPQRHYQAESDQTVTGSILPASDFTHIGEKLCQRQLLPGRELDSLQRVFMNGIHEALLWDKVTPKCTLRSCPRLKTVSLLSWCREVLLESATHAFFGERLMRINPNLFASFFIFDASSWKLNYGYPRFLSNELYAARDVIIDSLESYFKLPRSKRPGMSYLITQFEDEMKRLDIEERDIAALVMPVYWVYVDRLSLRLIYPVFLRSFLIIAVLCFGIKHDLTQAF